MILFWALRPLFFFNSVMNDYEFSKLEPVTVAQKTLDNRHMPREQNQKSGACSSGDHFPPALMFYAFIK